MAHDVFISHSNQDKTVASAICSRLEQAGIRCWIAPRDVRPGRNWGSEIIRGLDNAKVMIVVLSANSNCSRPVIKEVERAFGKEIVIIPVRTEKVVPSEALEFFLSSEQWLDAITPPLEPHLDRLAHTVKEYLIEQGWKEGTAASATAPPAAEERLSKEKADEIPPTDAASRYRPVNLARATTYNFQIRAGRGDLREAVEKAEGENAPPPQAEPPAPSAVGATAAIEDQTLRASARKSIPDAQSRLDPLSGLVPSKQAPRKMQKWNQPPARNGKENCPPSRQSLFPPRKDSSFFGRLGKAGGFSQPLPGWQSQPSCLLF